MLNFRDEYFIDFKESEEIVLEKLKKHLTLKTEGSLADYILDFCSTNQYRIEEIAELVKNDKELRTLLKQDCIFHGIFKNPRKVEEW